jgi:lipid-A-disaccharide synthase
MLADVKYCRRFSLICYCGCSKSGVFFYESFITNKNIKFISNKTYDLLKNSNGSFSFGTATLETALFKVPEVCYKEVGLLPNCKTDYYLKYISCQFDYG